MGTVIKGNKFSLVIFISYSIAGLVHPIMRILGLELMQICLEAGTLFVRTAYLGKLVFLDIKSGVILARRKLHKVLEEKNHEYEL